MAAALRLIDDRGLARLSMRRLGAELGVEAMSLYKHVANKEAVLDGVRELLLAEFAAEAAPRRGGGWADELIEFARRYRALGKAHPEAFSLLARGAEHAYVAGREIAETGLQGLAEAGFDAETATYALRTVVRWVLGFALVDMAEYEGPAPLSPTELSELAHDQPRVADLMRSLGPGSDDSLFEFGLALIIRGLTPEVPPP